MTGLPSRGIQPPTFDSRGRQPPLRRVGTGEPFVWLTGIGLAIGLTMVATLLAVIVVNGLRAFWPARIAEVTLTAEAGERLGGRVFLGPIVGERRIHASEPDESGAHPRELKLQIGNKDVFGIGFRYFALEDIESIAYPADAARIDRLEYGPAFGFLVGITLKDGARIAAESPEFGDAFDHLLDETQRRRAEISRIEKGRIGRIAERMTDLRREVRALERRAGDGAPDPGALAEIEARRAGYESEFESLAAEARSLREQLDAAHLDYRLVDGTERSVSFGEIDYLQKPNTLGLAGKLRVFLHNLWVFVSENPREANTEGGIFPAIFGTFVMTLILSVAVTPFGVIAAIYLREYARDGPLVRAVRIAINNLAGVPSIVFGVFGLGFFVYVLGGSIDGLFFRDHEGPVFGTGGILWASLTLALMTVPVVIVATEEALAAVSRGVREGSLACGASKWQTIQRIVLPAAAPGIITGMILAMARGAGEVAPLMITGVVKLAPTLPLDTSFPFLHLDRKFMHMGFHIYDLGFQSPDSDAARPMVFATTLLLIVLVVTMNLGAIYLRERLRRKYSTGAF